jgi:hypothetical protein
MEQDGWMDSRDLVRRYLDALEQADLPAMTRLFAPGATVHSPLYGEVPPERFYSDLFTDTAQARLTERAIMQGTDRDGRDVVSFFYHFDWRLSDGTDVPFDAVDVALLDGTGAITELYIVYDTAPLRAAFERSSGRVPPR